MRAALRLLSKDANGGVLSLIDLIPTGRDGEEISKTTRDILNEKHPKGRVASAEILLPESDIDDPCHNPIVFEHITGVAIRQAANRTHGAAGPSGVDAYAWHRLCSSFKSVFRDLCNALAAIARRLCTSNVHPDGLCGLPFDPTQQKPGGQTNRHRGGTTKDHCKTHLEDHQ